MKNPFQLKSQGSLQQNGPINFKLTLSENSRESDTGENSSPLKGKNNFKSFL